MDALHRQIQSKCADRAVCVAQGILTLNVHHERCGGDAWSSRQYVWRGSGISIFAMGDNTCGVVSASRFSQWAPKVPKEAPGCAGPSTAYSQPVRAGVCVTGEARSFALPGVRASLRNLLRMFDSEAGVATAVRMIIYRKGSASCSGSILSAIPAECRRAQEAFLAMPHSELQAEFPGASITLLNKSTCFDPLVAAYNESCCAVHRKVHGQMLEGSNTNFTREPGTFLQYVAFHRCAVELLRVHAASLRPITHLLKTRPDVIYPNAGHIARAVLSSHTPVLARKGERLTYVKGPTDIIFAAPARSAEGFFAAFSAPMHRFCAIYANSSLPSQMLKKPETFIFAPGGAGRSSFPTTLTFLPHVLVMVDGTPMCHVWENRTECDARSRDIIDGEYNFGEGKTSS